MTTNDIPSLQLLDAKAYLKDLTANVEAAKTRINLISLVFADDTHTRELVEALVQASKRGITVTIAADVFTYAEFGGYFSPFKRLTRKSRAVSAMTDRLRAAGATFTWLGRSFKLNPFSGVTHLKWAVVDDTTYCFGGVNLYEDGIVSMDYMLKSTSPALAQQISQQHLAIIASENPRRTYPGYKSECPYGTIYIDSGKSNDSMIYNRLIELSSQAEHVLVVTQYCPSGPLARQLQGKSDIYYNQPSQTPFPASLLIKYGQIRTGIHSQYTHPTYLHSKFMIFTMPGGTEIAMTGSHNFSHSGVMFGTREVALESSDRHVVKQLKAFYETFVK